MKIFLFSFNLVIKTAGSAQNIKVGRVSGNTAIFSRSELYNSPHEVCFRWGFYTVHFNTHQIDSD